MAVESAEASILTTLHLDVRLSLREVLELAEGTIPPSLQTYVREGVGKLERGYYGHAVAEATRAWKASRGGL